MNTINNYQNSYATYNQVSKPHSKHQKSKALDELVKAGTITQDQENAVKNAFKAGMQAEQVSAAASTTQINPLDGLVTDGKITQDQENAVKGAFDSIRQASYNFQMQKDGTDNKVNPLDELVKAGTLTQDQEDAVKSALENAFKTNEAQAAYSNGTTTVNPLDSLVKAGTITQDQENSINNALQAAKPHHHHHHHAQKAKSAEDLQSKLIKPLDELVKAGTITQDQENSIKSIFESAIKAYQTQSDSASESSLINPLNTSGKV